MLVVVVRSVAAMSMAALSVGVLYLGAVSVVPFVWGVSAMHVNPPAGLDGWMRRLSGRALQPC